MNINKLVVDVVRSMQGTASGVNQWPNSRISHTQHKQSRAYQRDAGHGVNSGDACAEEVVVGEERVERRAVAKARHERTYECQTLCVGLFMYVDKYLI